MKKIFSMACVAMFSLAVHAQQCGLDDVKVDARVGYNLGGTSPVGLPASIRELKSYDLTPSFLVGVDTEKPLASRLGLLMGLRLENKGMNVDARVKNYHMRISKGQQQLEGQFTGEVKTKVAEWMLTVPLQAAWHPAEAWRLRFGPYLSYVFSRDFSGYAHDGYLRVGSPTGAKVDIGSGPGQRGDYDFSSDMRRLQWGVSLGADWKCRRMGAFVELNWGLSGIHRSNFKTIEQTLYPLYGTVGLNYSLR